MNRSMVLLALLFCVSCSEEKKAVYMQDCFQVCKDYGLCVHNQDGECVARYDKDCRDSKACTSFGRCMAKHSDCYPTDESCRQSQICKKKGFCSLGDNGDYCALKSVKDCVAGKLCDPPRSKLCGFGSDNSGVMACLPWKCPNCKVEGTCRMAISEKGLPHCVVTVEGCWDSKNCKSVGFCTPMKDHCRAASDSDCRRSKTCRKWGRCTAVKGHCYIKPPSELLQ